MKRRPLLIVVVLLGACAHAKRERTPPENGDWLATLAEAQELAGNGQIAGADSVLAAYAARAPESDGARETKFWRGVFALDPADSSGGAQKAAASFDEYLADSSSRAHRIEALALRRSASAIDSLSQARAADSVPPVHLVVEDDSAHVSAREQELQKSLKRLQDSLDKTTTELDRIKKRLTTHKP